MTRVSFPGRKQAVGSPLKTMAHSTLFRSQTANQGEVRVESADVKQVLYPAIMGLSAKMGEIGQRIENERKIERIMREEAMRLVRANVNPDSIYVTTK